MAKQDRDGGPTSGPGKAKATNTTEADVSSTSGAYRRMLPRWELIATLEAGTEAMRAAAETYLPKHQYETKDAYEERLGRATLLNYTRFTLNSLTGKAFKEPPMLADDAPTELVDFAEDVDGAGTGMGVFARRWFKSGLAKAFCHVLVDFSRPEEREDGRPRTREDDARDGVRPFWVLVAPENVIFAHAETVDGREVYTHVRIRETETMREGFEEVVKERIRVLEPGYFWLYEKQQSRRNSKPKWVVIEEGAMGVDYVPMVTFYTDREGTAEGIPPLQDLAHLNVEHFQSKSDQRNVLTVARFPMLAVSGAPATDDETDQPLQIGPKKWLSLSDPQGKFYYVEHTGAAIEAGRNDLHDLEEQMSGYGAEFLKKRPGSVTATGRVLDSSEAISPLQAMGVDFRDAMTVACQMTLDWLNRSDADPSVVFEVDVDGALGDGKELDVLDKARTRRDISRVGYLGELKRRGVLDEDFDADDDKELLDEEVDEMGLFNEAGGDIEDDDEGDEPPVTPPANEEEDGDS